MRSSILYFLFLSANAMAHPGVGVVEDSKGNIFYTDLKQVWKIDPRGKKSIAAPRVHTHELFLDAHDNLLGEHLWYNGEANGTWGYYVWKLSADGKIVKVIPDTEGFRENYSFVQDKNGNMFKANRKNGCQEIVKSKGKVFGRLGNRCYHNIRFMAISKSNEVLIVDFQDVIKN